MSCRYLMQVLNKVRRMVMTNMSGIDAYKQSNQDYFEGIESPHGRIKILFDTIISSLDSMMETHPKTDFVSLGKCTNSITTLAESLNIKDGGELAQKSCRTV